ncbi:MAG TPA: T9SS type A sorting domain-containing protein, partial [Chitinophagales bacterium]|nr:T9SS type A sorting domain-containing protein [Chitinophagales bacterium]
IHKPSYFSVFPNPASNQILVQFQPKVSQYPYDYTIYDSTGRSVLKGKIYTDKTAIDISSLSNSWYQIQISDNNQLIDYKQFVKN